MICIHTLEERIFLQFNLAMWELRKNKMHQNENFELNINFS